MAFFLQYYNHCGYFFTAISYYDNFLKWNRYFSDLFKGTDAKSLSASKLQPKNEYFEIINSPLMVWYALIYCLVFGLVCIWIGSSLNIIPFFARKFFALPKFVARLVCSQLIWIGLNRFKSIFFCEVVLTAAVRGEGCQVWRLWGDVWWIIVQSPTYKAQGNTKNHRKTLLS